jgi:hypothetical protein
MARPWLPSTGKGKMWLDMCQKALTDPSMTDKTGAEEGRRGAYDSHHHDGAISRSL